MIRHVASIAVATLLVVTGTLLPFLPGRYDALATTVSAVSRLIGIASIVLVPLGAIWLTHEVRNKKKDADRSSRAGLGYWPGLMSIGVLTIIAVVGSAAAFFNVGPTLGLAAIALWFWYAVRLAARLKARQNATPPTFNAAPLYLIIVPLGAAVSELALVRTASERSRDRAIENSAALISDIERYYVARGHYPPSLLSLWKDYEPGVTGVEQYHYELQGDAYNLFFEHVAGEIGTREIVMYNKRDEHQMTSHDMDLLQLTPAALDVQRGYYAMRNASRPHWKLFWFD